MSPVSASSGSSSGSSSSMRGGGGSTAATAEQLASLLDERTGALHVLPRELTREVLVPLSGGKGLLRGTAVHTNEWMVLLGGGGGDPRQGQHQQQEGEGGYWVHVTADHARAIAQRRLDQLEMEDVVDPIEARKGDQQPVEQEEGEVVNLWEEYDGNDALLTSSVPVVDQTVAAFGLRGAAVGTGKPLVVAGGDKTKVQAAQAQQPKQAQQRPIAPSVVERKPVAPTIVERKPAAAVPTAVASSVVERKPAVATKPAPPPKSQVLYDVVERAPTGSAATVEIPGSRPSGYALSDDLVPKSKKKTVHFEDEDDDDDDDDDYASYDEEDEEEFLADLQQIELAYMTARRRATKQGDLPPQEDEEDEDEDEEQADPIAKTDNVNTLFI